MAIVLADDESKLITAATMTTTTTMTTMMTVMTKAKMATSGE